MREKARLEKALRHAEPGSDRAFKLQLKLDRLAAAEEGRPQPGFPDQYNRMLYEMKIPADRAAPVARRLPRRPIVPASR